MRVLNITKQKFSTSVNEDCAHKRSRTKRPTSNAEPPLRNSDHHCHNGTASMPLLIRDSEFDVECSAFLPNSRGSLVLFLANQGKFFAFYYRSIDGDFGDIFAARHVVHDI